MKICLTKVKLDATSVSGCYFYSFGGLFGRGC